MKSATLLVVLIILLGGSSALFAADQSTMGPEIIRFKMGDLTLPFRHWLHQKKIKGQNCRTCHRDKIGKIPGWSQDKAHTLCIPCHDAMNKGPLECKYCHYGVVGRK